MQTAVPEAAAPVPRMDATSLPENARYGADAVLLKSARVDSRFFPQNAGTFGPATSRVIRFDIASPDFLDLSKARLQGDLNVTIATSGSTTLDGGLGGLIQRISIMNASGQLLERIDDYNLLQTVLIQCSERARDHADELLLSEGFVNPSDVPEAVTGSGSLLNRIGTGVSRQYSHQLHGAWFQTHRKKLLPPGVSFKLEVELVASANECVSGTSSNAVTLTFSNVSMVIPTVQVLAAL